MVALFVGVPLEMVHRWWRLLLLYVAGVLAGSLAASMFDPKVSVGRCFVSSVSVCICICCLSLFLCL